MQLKELEKIKVTCLIDNSVDMLLSNTEVAHRPQIRSGFLENPPLAEHGFSAALSFETNGTNHVVLYDTGLSPRGVTFNVNTMNFDLSACETVVLSHGHIDHGGGLLEIRKKLSQKNEISLIAHSLAFRRRSFKFADGTMIDVSLPDKSRITKAGYQIVEKNSLSLWFDAMLVTGEIPRIKDFEKGLPNHFSEENGKFESDPLIKDDQAVVFNIRGKGLVVVTGCGHAGVINTLNYAKELTGVSTVHAVIGGMHLSGYPETIIRRTVEELEKLSPRYVIPCHCSGLKAMFEVAKSMPSSFVQNSVGTSFIF